VVICNKELVAPSGSAREVDFTIVGERAIFVIEEKSWQGSIHGNENGWVLASGESFVSPLQTAESSARRLAGLLRRNVPLLSEQIAGHFVFSRVLLSAGNVRIYVQDPRASERIMKLEGCEEELIRADRLQAEISSISRFRNDVIRALTELPDRPKIPRKVGEYEILESLPSSGRVRLLRGQHRDGSERLLKLVLRPTTVDEHRRHAEETAILREYDTLRKLAESGRVPKVDPYFSWDQERYWVFPIHPLPGHSLRADREAAPPTSRRTWLVIEDSFAALNEVHETGVIHRSLSPDRVHVLADGRVVFSDFIIARMHGEQTVADQAEDMDPADAYRAPECLVDPGLAEATSDVYSLAASLFYWITGHEPTMSDRVLPPLESLRTDLPDDLRGLLNELFEGCLAEDERKRPEASEALNKIRTARKDLEPEHPPTGGTELQPDQLLENQYRIVRKIGEGATAITYLAKDLTAEHLFVLKTIRNQELVAKLARVEFRSLMELNHPNLPRVFDIRPASSPFHLKLEYVRGSSLREVWNQYRGNPVFCLRIGEEVLRALSYLGERRLIHRDVSPSNILVPDEESGPVKLIDFGLATAKGEASTAVGTPRYRAPEIEKGGTWTSSCDLYSFGVVLFELLLGRLPYEVENDVPRKHRPAPPTDDEIRRFGPRLLDVLMKAVAPDPAQRFQTASDFAEALRNAAGIGPETALEGKRTINPFVDELRSVYRNSRVGNANNRGLDSEFAIKTYVETRLDRDLLPRLLAGDYRLLILSGNPGDGKTAFLQRFENCLRESGARLEKKDATGWRFRRDNRVYAALYDASESDGERRSDELLHGVLKPLSGEKPGDEGYVAAIAANDGRLLDFFERHQKVYPRLWDSVCHQLLEGHAPDESVLVVDLKRRSLVGYDPQEESLFSAILKSFLSQDHWAPCEECRARQCCPIRFNAISLSDPKIGDTVRRRLQLLLLAVHLRRERRPTVRDLRSALAFLITHELGCSQIHEEHENGKSPITGVERLYFNAAFNGAGSPDLLLDEWFQLDPGAVPAPRLDRFFHFHREREQDEAIRAVFPEICQRPAISLPVVSARSLNWLISMKRRYFFEAQRGGERGRWELPEPETILPYRHLGRFVKAVLGDEEEKELLHLLLKGISRADGVPAHACEQRLALRATETTQGDLTVVKAFSLKEFRIACQSPREAFAEEIPDQLVLRHKSGSPELSIGLDLFELICRSAEGYLPGPEEQRALMEDLAIFKSALLARPTREVSLIEVSGRTHNVRLHNGNIELEEVCQ
jgi:serine/threonine protein kinase